VRKILDRRGKAFNKIYFAGHPYAHPASGTPQALAATTNATCMPLHALLGAGRIKVAVVGVSRQQLT
jgi:hypothetical protein